MAELLGADDESAAPLARLHSFVRTFVGFSSRHPDLQRLMNIEGAASSDRLDYITETFVEPIVSRFLPLREELVERGEIRPVPPEVIFHLITSGGGAMFASRGMTERLFTDAPLAPERIEEYAGTIADLVINALRLPDAAEN